MIKVSVDRKKLQSPSAVTYIPYKVDIGLCESLLKQEVKSDARPFVQNNYLYVALLLATITITILEMRAAKREGSKTYVSALFTAKVVGAAFDTGKVFAPTFWPKFNAMTKSLVRQFSKLRNSLLSHP